MKPWQRIALLCCTVPAVALAQDKVNQHASILQDFRAHVAEYVKLHNNIRSEIHGLKPTKSAEAIEQYQQRFAQRLREARADAAEGDIFTSETAAEFRRLIRIAMRGPDAARIRASLESASPVELKDIRVNHQYPPGLPLESTPPSLLLNLPDLTPEVEYRVVGHALILRDIDANLIVDFIPDAIP